MDIRPIRTRADYAKALARIDALLDAKFGTPEGDELDVLTTLVEVFEQQHFAIGAPDPVDYIENAMEFRGLGQKDLADLLQSRSRACEILKRRRPLTLAQIRRISDEWRIPADPLIAEYEVARTG